MPHQTLQTDAPHCAAIGPPTHTASAWAALQARVDMTRSLRTKMRPIRRAYSHTFCVPGHGVLLCVNASEQLRIAGAMRGAALLM